MRGIFIFRNLQELVFHECDEKLWHLIISRFSLGAHDTAHPTDNLIDEKAGTYSNSATGYVLQFFAALLASHMFFTAEAAEGISQIEGPDGNKLTLSVVFGCTILLLTSNMKENQTRSLMTGFKEILRMFPEYCLTRVRDELLTNWNTSEFLRDIFRQLADATATRPSFLLQADIDLFLPLSISSRIREILKKISGLSAFRSSVEHVALTCGNQLVAMVSRSKASPISSADMRLLPLILRSFDLMNNPDQSDTLPSRDDDGRNQIFMEGLPYTRSTRTSLHSSNSSQSIFSSSSTPEFWENLDETQTTDASVSDTQQVVILLRGVNGVLRPHPATVVAITATHRLALISESSSNALVPCLYDALNLVTEIQTRMGRSSRTAIQHEKITAFGEVLQQLVLYSADNKKLSANLQKQIRKLVLDFESGTLDNLLSVSRPNGIRRFRIAENTLRRATATFEEALHYSLQPKPQTSQEEWVWRATTKKAQSLLRNTLQDFGSFLEVRVDTPNIRVEAVCSNSAFKPLHIVFVNHITDKCVVAETEGYASSSGRLGTVALVKVAQQDAIVGGNRLSSDGFTKVCFTRYRKATSVDEVNKMNGAVDYELFCWYGMDASDRQILKEQEKIIQLCLALNDIHPERRGTCSTLLERICRL